MRILGMNLKAAILTFVLLSWLSVCSYSQTNSANHKINVQIPEVALLGLVSDGTTGINLNTGSPSEAVHDLFGHNIPLN